MTYQTIRVRKLTPRIGAQISGVDLAKPLDDRTFREIKSALLAMSVLAKPALLLADEPTTALDPTTQRRVLARLASLRERGMSILLVTHDLGVVAEIADRVLVLQQGVIVEQGATAQLLRAPASAYARTLLDAARQMEGLPCLP